MNFSKKENKLALDWYANDAEPNGVEFIFKTTKTKNTQTLMKSSGSNSNWDVKLYHLNPLIIGKVEFRLNSSVGSESIFRIMLNYVY